MISLTVFSTDCPSSFFNMVDIVVLWSGDLMLDCPPESNICLPKSVKSKSVIIKNLRFCLNYDNVRHNFFAFSQNKSFYSPKLKTKVRLKNINSG